MDEPHHSRGTLLINTLLQGAIRQREELQDEEPFSLTAYHLTNSGQGVGLDIYHLPLQIIGFLREMESADYRAQWSEIVNRAWKLNRRISGKKIISHSNRVEIGFMKMS